MFSSFSMSKPSLRSVSMQISTLRSFVYVDCSGESRRMYPLWNEAGTSSRSVAEQPVEPPLPQLGPALVDGGARRRERLLELAQRHLLLLLVARDVLALAGQLRLERLALRLQLRARLVERCRHVRLQRAELRAVGVRVEHGELRLRAPQRHLLALPRHARGEDLVLELVLGLGELGGGEPSLARLAEAVEPLALVAVRGLLLALAERGELRAREEIVVARDDRRLLRGLLLPHANRAALLGTLVEVFLQPLLVLGRAPDCLGDAHRGKSTTGYDRAASEADAEHRVAAYVRGSDGRTLDRPGADAGAARRARGGSGAAARGSQLPSRASVRPPPRGGARQRPHASARLGRWCTTRSLRRWRRRAS